MIPKKGLCVTRLVEERCREAGGLALPESGRYGRDRFVVLSVNAEDSEVKPGDVAFFEDDPARTVRIDFNGERVYVRPVSDALALVNGCGCEVEAQSPLRSEEVPALGVRGVGEKVMIVGRPVTGTYRVGSLFIPYERREVCRLNHGVVASLSDEVSDRTGISAGMFVLYDYNSTYGHFDGFDVTNEENVVAILTKEEVEHLDGGRE